MAEKAQVDRYGICIVFRSFLHPIHTLTRYFLFFFHASVEAGPAFCDTRGCISSTSAVTHILETDNDYFLSTNFFILIYRFIYCKAIQQSNIKNVLLQMNNHVI